MQQANKYKHILKNKNINWYKWILISLGSTFSFLLLFIPLITIFIEAFSLGGISVLNNLKNTDMCHAILLTILIALITIPINLIFGVLAAWLITRFDFFWRQTILTLFHLPFAISPVIVGLMYLLFYGINSPVGFWLDQYHLQVIFSWSGMILVTIFITCPFIVLELVPVMLKQGKYEEECAVLLGASGWKIFWHITFPNIRLPILYGIVLTNARAIGEFGAVSVISGSIRGETYTLPLQIELFYQDYNNIGAFTGAALLAIIAMLTLFLINILQWKIKTSMHRML